MGIKKILFGDKRLDEWMGCFLFGFYLEKLDYWGKG